MSFFEVFITASSLLYAVVFVVMLIVHPGSEKFYLNFHNFYQVIPPIFAGICAISFARLGQHTSTIRRTGWILIGIGALSWGVGQGTWAYYESVRGIKVPFPSMADAGYLGGYPFLIAGVFLLFGSMRVTGRARLVLDSAIAASSVGVLSWYFLVSPSWTDAKTTLLEKVLGAAYPLGDVVIFFAALVLFSTATTTSTLRRSLIFLMSGIVLLALADSTFFYHNLHDIYQTGSWFDWGWSFGWLLIGYSALLQLWWPHQELQDGTVPKDDLGANESIAYQHPQSSLTYLTPALLARVLMPYTLAAVAFSIVASHDYKQDREIDPSTLIAGLWLIALVIFRQVLTLLENQHLTVQLRGFNANLEDTVMQRTQQLKALHSLTKAVNNTLQVDEVLGNAAEHTMGALRAEAVMLQVFESTYDVNGGDAEYSLEAEAHRGLDHRPDVQRFLAGLPLANQVETIVLSPAPPEATFDDGSLNHQVPPTASDSYYLRAPLLWHNQPIGTIGVVRRQNSFGNGDSVMLESIGLEVAAAYKNAQLYAAAVENADRDSVTGLYNHRAVHQRLDAEFHRAERQNSPLAVIMMDLNNFKLFNDTYGHPVGDQVLKRVAHVLNMEFRKADILGRYGGDEFIAILPDTDLPLAMMVAQRLRDRMAAEGFYQEDEERAIPVTLSLGLATYPEDSANRYELVAVADANLYTAKVSERGIVATSDTQRGRRQLRTESSFDVLDAMVTAVDNKDHYTRRHSEDVTEYAIWIAEELGLSEETMRVVSMSGLLHDVGKIGVPETILRKPGRLTAEEFHIMKQHPEFGSFIVGGVPGLDSILEGVRSHHERWDGKGYPDGLAAEAIPFMGRLLAVADACSAMTTDRPYRKGLAWEDAMEEIRANVSTQFDPAMANAFLRASHKRRPIQKNGQAVLQLVPGTAPPKDDDNSQHNSAAS
jgi:diguanylate cyclase (GGDEF)-like protein